MKERLKKIIHKEREILVLNYSNAKEAAMIEILLSAKEQILKEDKEVLVLSIFNHKNFASPKFIRRLEKELSEVQHLIGKNAVTGISEVQRWIVKGINLWYKKQLYTFDSVDEALDFLVS